MFFIFWGQLTRNGLDFLDTLSFRMSKPLRIPHFLFELVMLLSLEWLRKPLKTAIIKLIRVNLSISKSPENAAPPHKQGKLRVRLVSLSDQSSRAAVFLVWRYDSAF